MTTYTKYGNAVKSPTSVLAIDAVDAEGQVRVAYSKISVAADEGIGSVHVLARIPSNARLLPQSQLLTSALTSLTDYDVGFGINGTVVNTKGDALVNGADIHTAAAVSMVSALAVGSVGKKVWEMAGYTADPGGMIDIIGTVKAASTATGTIESYVHYAKK